MALTLHQNSGLTTIGNGLLRAVIANRGAKISSLVYLPLDEELLWTREAPGGEGYDASWTGGWDEIFPNDEPASANGHSYPDHGELWNLDFTPTTHLHPGHALVELNARCSESGVEVTKTIELRDGESKLRFHHTIHTPHPIHHIWKLHPAFAVEEGDRIHVPASCARLEPRFLGTLNTDRLIWRWPHVNGIDMSAVPGPAARAMHFCYALGLHDGWCGIYRPSRQLAFGLSFPTTVFPACTLFASFGGWPGCHVAVLEPSAGYPFVLEEAIAQGTCGRIESRLDADIIFTARHAVNGLSRITQDGGIEE